MRQVGIFGKRKSGKSALMYALTKYKMANETQYSTMEIGGVEKIMLVDTMGVDVEQSTAEKSAESIEVALVLISNDSFELELAWISKLKRIGAKIIAMCGRKTSTLGNNCDYFINIGVEKEACTLGLAPTASTTATLAMGDAIAMALMNEKKFTSQDFALFHPGGALGRKLLLTVGDVMHSGEDNPIVKIGATVRDALFEMTEKGLGAVSIVNADNKFVGIVTDGIIRRALEKDLNFIDEPVEHIMFKDALIIRAEKLAAEALSVMEKHKPRPITVLPVVDADKNPVGIIHLTDLLRQGVV